MALLNTKDSGYVVCNQHGFSTGSHHPRILLERESMLAIEPPRNFNGYFYLRGVLAADFDDLVGGHGEAN
jgi:hypothetical protein